tara:strand:- start:79 stop:276 length:198 start_codon:yes stop_codon:yes gene_type:complete
MGRKKIIKAGETYTTYLAADDKRFLEFYSAKENRSIAQIIRMAIGLMKQEAGWVDESKEMKRSAR